MEQLTDRERNNLALMLFYSYEKFPIPSVRAEAENLATKLGVKEDFDFFKNKWPQDQPNMENLVKPGNKDKN
jgi:hypothetical protein